MSNKNKKDKETFENISNGTLTNKKGLFSDKASDREYIRNIGFPDRERLENISSISRFFVILTFCISLAGTIGAFNKGTPKSYIQKSNGLIAEIKTLGDSDVK